MRFNFWLQNRNISYKSIRTWYAGLKKPKKKEPPYDHIIQIGDPALRQISEKVPQDLIGSPEIKFVIERMKQVMKKYNCVGLSAPQIGVPIQIFIFEFNEKHAKHYSKIEFVNMEMKLHPQSVVINPEMKVSNYEKVVFPESCESVRGLYADVPRYKAVELKGFNENCQFFELKTNGWLARIIQHEMDHIQGKMYTDIMNRRSLTCSCWDIINERGGKVELPYGPV